MSENSTPLPFHPFLSEDFFPAWSTLTDEAIEPDITAAIALGTEKINAICTVTPDTATYENTFGALENATESLELGWGRLHHLNSVEDSPAQREALNAMLPEVSAFTSSISLNPQLWEVLKNFANSPAAAALSPIQQRHLEETCHDFTSSGADLPASEKETYATLQAELAQVTQQFSQNVLDSTNAWELILPDATRLAGLPASALEAAQQDALAKLRETEPETEKTASYRFTLQHPSIAPVMKYAEDDSLRKELWEASGQVGHSGEYENEELVKKILQLRHQKAQLLGKNNFVEHVLERRMAKTPQTVTAFTEDLHSQIKDTFKAECEQLTAYKATKTDQAPSPLHPWEVSYWSEKQRKELYDLDEEQLRPYFPVDRVMAGMFDIATTLFGVTITTRKSIFLTKGQENPDGLPEVWNPEVNIYDLKDSASGDLLGSFFADWHPRASKRGGAWMNSLSTGLPPLGDQPRIPHLGLICGNMTKPIGDQPALLTHREVETIFHEFGHLLHHLLSQVEVKSLSGTNVAWDFVELPSQIMENYCWDRQSLDLFARHVDTGAAIPEALLEKMHAARNYQSASFFMRQLALGKIDIELHLNAAELSERDLDEVDREILADYRAELSTQGPSIVRGFNHLFSSPTGYASGYYSYKWAEVLDADAFTRFQKEGILNPQTGRDFREQILSKGNSAPPQDLYKNFMQRDPSTQPLLVRVGLA